jgi:hypothetical protein
VITRRTGVDHLSDLPATAAGFGLGRHQQVAHWVKRRP